MIRIFLVPHPGFGRSDMRPWPRFGSRTLSSKHEDLANAEIQPVGEAEMAEDQYFSPRWTLEGQYLGQDGPRQPPLLPSPHLEQSAGTIRRRRHTTHVLRRCREG